MPRLQSLGRMTQDWIAQGIMRTQLVDVVDPRAVFVQGQRGRRGRSIRSRWRIAPVPPW